MRTKDKKTLFLFKVDFKNVYDSVNWKYLEAVVLVNRSLTYDFPLYKGLRKGDMISPFLFSITAEGLNVIMNVIVGAKLFSSL
jgi:hypothetical protein